MIITIFILLAANIFLGLLLNYYINKHGEELAEALSRATQAEERMRQEIRTNYHKEYAEKWLQCRQQQYIIDKLYNLVKCIEQKTGKKLLPDDVLQRQDKEHKTKRNENNTNPSHVRPKSKRRRSVRTQRNGEQECGTDQTKKS